MIIRSHTELTVYCKAFDVAMQIFSATRNWPRDERYSLTDQIRRSTRSVCSNIAEAWGKRRYPAHFVSKIADAHSECLESVTWLDFAHACAYLDRQSLDRFRQSMDEVGAMLHSMEERPHLWTYSR